MMSGENERMAVLKMIGDGQVNAEDGARLLTALSGPGKRPFLPSATEMPNNQSNKPRWFRVRVTDTFSGKTKVTVNLPFAMVRWGLNIGAQYAPEVNEFNLQELADILEQGFQGKLVDVLDEEDGEHVEIFVE